MKMPAKSVADRNVGICDRDKAALELIRRSGREFTAENLAQALVYLMDQEVLAEGKCSDSGSLFERG